MHTIYYIISFTFIYLFVYLYPIVSPLLPPFYESNPRTRWTLQNHHQWKWSGTGSFVTLPLSDEPTISISDYLVDSNVTPGSKPDDSLWLSKHWLFKTGCSKHSHGISTTHFPIVLSYCMHFPKIYPWYSSPPSQRHLWSLPFWDDI